MTMTDLKECGVYSSPDIHTEPQARRVSSLGQLRNPTSSITYHPQNTDHPFTSVYTWFTRKIRKGYIIREMLASGTANRGVEAKEYEIADTVLDENSLAGSQGRDSVARASSTHTHTVDETNSYIQVVVQKQRRGRGARLPAASSPAPTPHKLRNADAETRGEGGGECGDDATLLLLPSRSPLLLLPPLAFAAMSPAPHHNAHEFVRNPHGEEQTKGAGGGDAQPSHAGIRGKTKCKSSWRLFSFNAENLDTSDCGPEGFEVYYFESAEAAHLTTRGGARPTHVERCVRRAQRRAAALLDELLAAARLLLAAPFAVLLAVMRCGLQLARDVASGVVQSASDFVLKPALALLYNGVLQPPLVLVASAARGVRAALQPVCAALGDALDPLARVLHAVRLVHVHVERAPHCSCGRDSKNDSNA